ncbi:MAG: hypothetical protein AB7N70_13895 [Dehalococcoidia bacterium]
MTISYPTTAAFLLEEFSLGLQRNIDQRRNPLTRRRKTIEHPGALWVATLVYPDNNHADRAQIEAFWNRVSDADETVLLWHIVRPSPGGTLQANTTASASAAEGASTINLNATTGLTLLAGDMFSVALTAGGTQLVQVVADVTSAAGVMTAVAFVPPLVGAVSNGAAVVVDKPTTPFRIEEAFVPATYRHAIAPAFPVVLIEDPSW